MRTTHRIKLTISLTLIGFLIFLSLIPITIYLAPPRPANAQSADLNTSVIKWSGGGLKLELQAMPLDLVRAFFLGRGFSAIDADYIAKTGCIYRSALGNNGVKSGDPATVIELTKWRIIGPKEPQVIQTRQQWAKIWDNRKVSKNAKVAFHWALFPTSQSYRSSDYNWGMISFNMPPGTRFDLEVRWRSGDVEKNKMLKKLECGK
ncbi:MAG: hypothetical protein GY927_05000 [bacterium]|nr:hypothetical protein [bacterium]